MKPKLNFKSIQKTKIWSCPRFQTNKNSEIFNKDFILSLFYFIVIYFIVIYFIGIRFQLDLISCCSWFQPARFHYSIDNLAFRFQFNASFTTQRKEKKKHILSWSHWNSPQFVSIVRFNSILTFRLWREFVNSWNLKINWNMEKDTLIVLGTAIICLSAYLLKYRKSRKRRFWVNPYLRMRNYRSRHHDVCTKYHCYRLYFTYRQFTLTTPFSLNFSSMICDNIHKVFGKTSTWMMNILNTSLRKLKSIWNR